MPDRMPQFVTVTGQSPRTLPPISEPRIARKLTPLTHQRGLCLVAVRAALRSVQSICRSPAIFPQSAADPRPIHMQQAKVQHLSGQRSRQVAA